MALLVLKPEPREGYPKKLGTLQIDQSSSLISFGTLNK